MTVITIVDIENFEESYAVVVPEGKTGSETFLAWMREYKPEFCEEFPGDGNMIPDEDLLENNGWYWNEVNLIELLDNGYFKENTNV